MARDYGKVYTRFWSSADVAALSDTGKLLAVYLLSCEHGNLIGCFRLPLAYVAADLNWPLEQVRLAMYALRDSCFLIYDDKSQWVCIPKYLRWNPIENPNQGKAALKLIGTLPNQHSILEPIVGSLRASYATEEGFKALGKGFTEKLETLVKGLENGSETVSKPVTVTGAVAVTGKKTLLSNEKPFDGSVPESQETQPKANEAEKQAVTEVWDYYLAAVDRKANMYEFTPMRKRKGLARLRECLRKTGGDYPKAVELMKLCVNAMCASDHHMGRSQSSAGKRYVEWEKHLFATQEQLEKWLMANDEAIA